VSEIATLCGFASAFHFSRRFKETYGQSPRDVRHAVRHGATPPLRALLQHVRL
jgi:transcriptional regulator GlxA family with amidase domain